LSIAVHESSPETRTVEFIEDILARVECEAVLASIGALVFVYEASRSGGGVAEIHKA
jgi:hypothetical protein